MTDAAARTLQALARKPPTFDEVLGSTLQQTRRLEKMRQTTLAAQLGISVSTMSRIESGKQALSVEQLRVFAVLFQTTPARLLDTAQRVADALGVK